MPILALFFGIMLIEVGIRNNAKPMFAQLASDAQGFLAFGAAIMILAVLGSLQPVRPVAKALMVLVFAVFLLKNGNAVIRGLTASASATAVDTSSGNQTYNPNASPSSVVHP
jgi:uncharacterized membrane protein